MPHVWHHTYHSLWRVHVRVNEARHEKLAVLQPGDLRRRHAQRRQHLALGIAVHDLVDLGL
jgi:hypothetical protein